MFNKTNVFMKSKIKIGGFLVWGLIHLSCEKDYINLAPFSESNVENFYKTESDFENAVNATYDVLQDGRLYSGHFEFVLEVRSDNGVFNDPASASGAPFNIDKFLETTTSPYIEGPYKALYQGVQRANLVLSRIVDTDINNPAKLQYQAEVRFLRALYYFHLIRLWRYSHDYKRTYSSRNKTSSTLSC